MTTHRLLVPLGILLWGLGRGGGLGGRGLNGVTGDRGSLNEEMTRQR